MARDGSAMQGRPSSADSQRAADIATHHIRNQERAESARQAANARAEQAEQAARAANAAAEATSKGRKK